jgi:hypothetical protein
MPINPTLIRTVHVSVHGDRGYPVGKAFRITAEQAALERLEPLDDLLVKARKLNPELSLETIITASLREGVGVVLRQIESGRLSKFLKHLRS